MIKFECWLVPIFLYIFFILLNLPSKKHQNACANIGGKQNLRSENSRKWIESLKTCPPIHENAKNTTLKLESIHPCLHILTVLKPKLPSATFFRLHKCTKTWKWAQNTRLPWNQHKAHPPQWKSRIWAQIPGVGPPQTRWIRPWFPFLKKQGFRRGFRNPSSKISARRKPVGKGETRWRKAHTF